MDLHTPIRCNPITPDRNTQSATRLFCHGSGLSSLSFIAFLRARSQSQHFRHDLRSHGVNPAVDPMVFENSDLILYFSSVLQTIDAHFGKTAVACRSELNFGRHRTLLADDCTKYFREHGVIRTGAIAPSPDTVRALFDEIMKRVPATTRQRKRHFANLDDLQKTLPKSIAAQMSTATIEELCRTLVRPTERGFELCCDPEIEARVYEQVRILSPRDAFDRITNPVLIMAGRIKSKPNTPASWHSISLRLVDSISPCSTSLSHLGWIEQPKQLTAVASAHIHTSH